MNQGKKRAHVVERQPTALLSIRVSKSFKSVLEKAAAYEDIALSPYLERLLKSSTELHRFLIDDTLGIAARQPDSKDVELARLSQVWLVAKSFDRLTDAIGACTKEGRAVDALRVYTELHAIAQNLERLQRSLAIHSDATRE